MLCSKQVDCTNAVKLFFFVSFRSNAPMGWRKAGPARNKAALRTSWNTKATEKRTSKQRSTQQREPLRRGEHRGNHRGHP